MAENAAGQNSRHFPIINLCCSSTVKCRQLLVERVIPGSKKFVISGAKIYQAKLAPRIKRSSCCIKGEALRIHNKQNWLKRCGTTALDNAAGLGMAILTTKIVQSHIEVEGFSNMWGLFSSRPVVSEGTYEVISFAVEFFIALIAFTLTDHYLEEYRKKKNSTEVSTDQTQLAKTSDEAIAEVQATGTQDNVSVNQEVFSKPGH